MDNRTRPSVQEGLLYEKMREPQAMSIQLHLQLDDVGGRRLSH